MTILFELVPVGEFLPNHIGLPLADGNKAKYFMLEIHYDNPELRQGKEAIQTYNIKMFN
jgi:hypothetical protein